MLTNTEINQIQDYAQTYTALLKIIICSKLFPQAKALPIAQSFFSGMNGFSVDERGKTKESEGCRLLRLDCHFILN